MAEPIGALRALLSASSAVFEKDMKQARDAVRKNTVDMSAAMEKFAGKANQSIKAIFTMRTALTLLAGTTGLFYATKRAVEFADSIDKTSKSVGLGAEVFQEYRIAAALSGVGQEKFTAALTKFTQTVGAAARGSKSAIEKFKEFGITVRNNDGTMKSNEALLREVSDALAAIENPSARAAAAVELFGKSGARMGVFLAQGSDAIDEMRQRARDLGLVLSEETIEKAAKANDQFDLMSDVIKIGLAAALLETIPLWQKLAGLVTSDTFVLGMREVASATLEVVNALDGATAALDRFLKNRELMKETRRNIMEGVGTDMGARIDAVNDNGLAMIKRVAAENAAIMKNAESGRAFFKSVTPPPAVTGLTGAGPRDSEKEDAESTGRRRQETDDLNRAMERENDLLAERKRILEDIKTPSEKYEESVQRLNVLFEGGYLTADQYSRAFDNLRADIEDIDGSMDSVSETSMEMGRSIADSLKNATMGVESFSDALKNLAQNIAGMIMDRAVFSPLGDALGGFIDRGLGSLFGGARAAGGPVRAGRTYLVGENGPELRTDLGTGQIIPNDALGGLGGNTYMIDARGTDESVVKRLEATIIRYAGPGVTERRTMDAMKRGRI